MARRSSLVLCVLLALPAVPLGANSLRSQVAPPEVIPFHASGIYGIGDTVGWSVIFPLGATGTYSFTIKANNAVQVASGELDAAHSPARIETTLKEPAMVYMQLRGPQGGRSMNFGAAVDPTELKPVQPAPRDFDAFWRAKIKELEAIPMNPVVTATPSNDPDVELDIVQLDQANGHKVHGLLAKPAKAGKYPAMLILQWASPPYPLQPAWVIGPARQGWLTLNVEPHDVLPDAPRAYYDALPRELKNYNSIGWDDRNKSYFLQMILGDYRAVDYLASRPDWDGKTLVVTGTSMGGQQSLCVAGLHPKISDVLVEEPSGCDLTAALHGRQTGYPFFPSNNPKVMAAAPYFDAINFAPHIRAKALVAMGFVDTVAPPTGIWTAFNLIRGPKEVAPMPDAPHNNTATRVQQMPWFRRSAAWLDTLVKGGQVKPAKRF
ncbi:MAG: acetylxylan esterase [Fimbriimonadaceae bacterium]